MVPQQIQIGTKTFVHVLQLSLVVRLISLEHYTNTRISKFLKYFENSPDYQGFLNFFFMKQLI